MNNNKDTNTNETELDTSKKTNSQSDIAKNMDHSAQLEDLQDNVENGIGDTL